MDTGEFGRKVFFLYPHSVFEEHLLMDLIKSEFEVYLIKDHQKFFRILNNHPSSLLFINIDDGLKEPEWEKVIKEIQGDQSTQGVGLGILTYNDNKELAQKYLMEFGLACGFITLKLGLEQSKNILMKTLEANEARGRRKYIRVICPPGTAEFNVKISGDLYSGTIVNISSVGMAIKFSNAKDLREGSRIPDIQLMLKGMRLMVTGIVVLKRPMEGGGEVLVMMFDPMGLGMVKEKIYTYILRTLQGEAEKMLSGAPSTLALARES